MQRKLYKRTYIGTAMQRKPLHPENHEGSYLKSMVYGGMDGIITTFAIVAGVAGASLSSGVLLILGFANLIADGISMAVGDYLSSKSEQQYTRNEQKRETQHIKLNFAAEKRALTQSYRDKGLSLKDASKLVTILAKDKKTFVEAIMTDERGIVERTDNPIKNGAITFCSFVFFGFIPLLTFVIAQFYAPLTESSFIVACLLTGMTLFILGGLKGRITERSIAISGLETLLIGGLAALAAFIIGNVLSHLVL